MTGPVVRRWLRRSAIVAVGMLVVIQLVPYGRDHSNPPVAAEPAWDSPATRELAVRSCFDCHSNETVWPWYSNVAPASWLTQHDVEEGRAVLNFSEWNGPTRRSRDAAETVREGEMPPIYYLPTHPSARLDNAELSALAEGLTRTLGSDH